MKLVQVPSKSPGLNPVERFWGKLDLADLRTKRRPVCRTALQQRVRSIMRSQEAQGVARKSIKGLRRVCRDVKASGGRASRG